MGVAQGMPPTLEVERRLWAQGHRYVAGLDEAGRGPWAGPVIAAAVVLPPNKPDLETELAGVNDSKRLTPAQREVYFRVIQEIALAVGVGQATPQEIDRLGIVEATKLAMRRAIERLPRRPDYLLIDHLSLPLPVPQESFVRGDARVLSIAAASIVAKVVRDDMMRAYDVQFPGYGFARHKGYGTPEHQQALRRLGPTPIHRRTWEPVRQLIEGIDLDA